MSPLARRPLLGCLAAALALLLLPPLAVRGLTALASNGGRRSGGAGRATAPVSPTVRALGGIRLPAPLGTAPRTRPLIVVLLPDESLGPAGRKAVAAEAEVWRRYVATYGMAEDRIVVADRSIGLLAHHAMAPGLIRDIAQLTVAPPPGTQRQRVLSAEQVLQQFPRADHLLLAMTANRAPWPSLLPAEHWLRTRPGARDRRARLPRRLGAIAVRSAGATAPASAIGTGSRGPDEIVIGTARGDVATALARTWVRATGAGWSGQ